MLGAANIISLIPSVELATIVITIVTNFLLAFTVLRSDSKNSSNRVFFLLNFLTFIWLILAYLLRTNRLEGVLIDPTRLTVSFAAAMTVLIFIFAKTTPLRRSSLPVPLFWFLGILTVFLTSLSFTHNSFQVSFLQSLLRPGSYISPLFLFYFTILLFIVSLLLLYRNFKKELNQKLRKHLKIALLSILALAILSLTAIVIETTFTHSNFYNVFIPLFSIIFLSIISSSMVRHQFFQIKTVAIEGLTILIWAVLLLKITPSDSLFEASTDIALLIVMVVFGLFFMRHIGKGIRQKEQLTKLSRSLSRANRKLIRADQTKNEFLSFASHDLKSPVAKMKQWASLIEDETISEPKDIKETVIKIKTTAQRSLSLVEEFLDFREIEEGKVEYNFEEIDFVAFVKEIVSDLDQIAKQNDLNLEFKTDTREILLQADTIKLRQVVENLLDNALKYTEKGEIIVSCQDKGRSALLTVKDTGLGIQRELLPKLFGQFHRDKKVRKNIKGTGLGLFIAKQVVTGHRGEIWAKSDGEGRGSTFFVELPK